MTQQTHSAPPAVYLDELKNLDKTIDLARLGARKDHVTVIVQRLRTTKRGDVRRSPILEITPAGDVLEIPAPRLRTPISTSLSEADLLHRTGRMNVRSGEGHVRFAELVKVSRDYIAAAEAEQSQKRHRGGRRSEKRVA